MDVAKADRARRLIDDLPLFAATPRAAAPSPQYSALDTLIAAIAALNPDEMSPREAIEALYALKAKAMDKTTDKSAGQGKKKPQ